MTTLKASRARIPTEEFNQVVYNGEVVEIQHRSGKSAYLVSESDMSILKSVKERQFNDAADRAFDQYGELLTRLAQ